MPLSSQVPTASSSLPSLSSSSICEKRKRNNNKNDDINKDDDNNDPGMNDDGKQKNSLARGIDSGHGEGGGRDSTVLKALWQRRNHNRNESNITNSNTSGARMLMDWNTFITTIWEQTCLHLPATNITTTAHTDDISATTTTATTDTEAIKTMKTTMKDNNNDNECKFLEEILQNGWKILLDLMDNPKSATTTMPLIFQDLQPLSSEQIRHQFYDDANHTNVLYAAYLAGSSIVWNHVDLQSPYIAQLCQDLQGDRIVTTDISTTATSKVTTPRWKKQHKIDPSRASEETSSAVAAATRPCGDGSFPHVYANAYLTPPQTQTVPPHADDRDVLIIQMVGRKFWHVYATIPIPHPYPHEQVGKSGVAVPPEVLQGPLAFQQYLNAGDVLYIPRGMVHEAKTTLPGTKNDTNTTTASSSSSSSLSFHITVAIATQDWTIGGNLVARLHQHEPDHPHSLDDRDSNTDDDNDAPLSYEQKLQMVPQCLRRSIVPTTLPKTTTTSTYSKKNSATTANDDEIRVIHGGSCNISKMCDDIHRSLFCTDDSKKEDTTIRDGSASTTQWWNTQLANLKSATSFLSVLSEEEFVNNIANYVVDDIQTKLDFHNTRAREQRRALLLRHRYTTTNPVVMHDSAAATTTSDCRHDRVTLETYIRSSTPEERDYVLTKRKKNDDDNANNHRGGRGLNVRDEIGDDIGQMIGHIKQNYQKQTAHHAEQPQQQLGIQIKDFHKLLSTSSSSSSLVCKLTCLSLAKCAIELGAFVIV